MRRQLINCRNGCQIWQLVLLPKGRTKLKSDVAATPVNLVTVSDCTRMSTRASQSYLRAGLHLHPLDWYAHRIYEWLHVLAAFASFNNLFCTTWLIGRPPAARRQFQSSRAS
jgi:hypothetical protein